MYIVIHVDVCGVIKGKSSDRIFGDCVGEGAGKALERRTETE